MRKQASQRRTAGRKTIFTMRVRLTVFVAGIVLASILISSWTVYLLEKVCPVLDYVPELLQVCILSLMIAVLVAWLISKIFCEPIQELLAAMKKVAAGDFSTRLRIKSSAKEIQEMTRGFNLMVDELRSTEVLQTDFISNVSHEFKTPINAIEGYATLLQETDDIDSAKSEYIEKILFSTRRLSSLVNNILLLSKVENQSIESAKVRFALDEQIREVIVVSEPVWAGKGLDFDVELEDIRYYGNEQWMYHVWSNLIGNAVKFSPENGIIRIRLAAEADKIRFTIDDEGPGLSEEAEKHLFDKFYQADSSHKQEGNGLGLALVKRIVSIAGDQVYAENLPGKGCRFTVILNFPEKPE